MKETIFTILTNKRARNTTIVTASLDKEFAVGAPWFSKIVLESFNVK
jgi:hypothetical protein